MKTFKNIHIENNKTNVECVLDELGHINVLCGKNNSGKTRVLESLLSKENYKIYLDITGTSISSLYSIYNNENNLSTLYEIESYFNKVESTKYFVGEKLLYNDIIYQLNSSVKNGELVHIFNGSRSSDYVLELIPKIFSLNGNIQFINAKRNIYNDKIFENAIENLDMNIVNYLSYCKNQLPNSKEYKWFEEVSKVFEKLTGGFKFSIQQKNTSSDLILHFSPENDRWFDYNQSGLGLSDLLYILALVLHFNNDIVIIEEPENHIHAHWQRELLRFLSLRKDKQFFISTHSNIFLDQNFVDKIFHVQFNGKIEVTEATDKAFLLQSLGYTAIDNFSAELLIIVEGKTDVPVIDEFLRTLNISENYNINILSLGHINSISDADYNVLTKNFNQIIVLVDGDMNKESKIAREKIRERTQEFSNVSLVILKGYGIENYLNVNKIEEYYKFKSYSLDSSFYDCVEDNKLVLDKEIKGLRKDEKNYRLISNLMTEDDIKETGDLYDNFIEKVKEVCKKLPNKRLNN